MGETLYLCQEHEPAAVYHMDDNGCPVCKRLQTLELQIEQLNSFVKKIVELVATLAEGEEEGTG